MPTVGTADHPLRVAIVGAGPAGFYAADALLKQDALVVEVDLLDRLPTPFGLVRSGVAPDHQKIKNVTRVFEKVAEHPRFRFFGNVCYGEHLGLDDLRRHYHQVLFTTGAETDRRLGIPGEDLAGSHSATEFVWWYNGHPGYCDSCFDLSAERVAIVGVGNVAVDVARILCRTPEELATTDIADYALEALRESRVREVVLLGRRGPAQAAFTAPEVKELGEMPGADVYVQPDEAELDPISREEMEAGGDRPTAKKVEIVQEYARRAPTGKPRRLVIRFLVSPTELVDDGTGRVGALRLVRNRLVRGDDGRVRPQPTGETEELPVGLVFRSVGYQGVPLPGLPFHDRWGVVPNEGGRVTGEDGRPLAGLYVAGWIKRGPSGVIGTNKPDAQETVEHMLADAAEGRLFEAEAATAEAAERRIREAQPHVVTFDDWRHLDAVETAAGAPHGRPRVKLTRVEDMLAAIRERRGAEQDVAG
ncbi:MAG TPA: FAD-dependent oxidoreductase [Rubricoccaceae bacterium]|nr:FAD-dependent oxidoreductase [Rubricoccaceae bacterium]